MSQQNPSRSLVVYTVNDTGWLAMGYTIHREPL